MFYYLFYPLHTKVFAFNIFRYITFRAAYAGITALLISFIFGPKLIRFLKRHKFCAGIREEGLKNQKEKVGTPTMGGILILAAVIVSTLLWADFKESFIIISLLTVVSLGILGFYDDYKKTRKGKGVRGLYKIIWQILIGVSVGIWLYFFPKLPDFVTKTSLLFLKNTFIQLSYFYVPFVVLVLVGTSNAVNLTDGLDGLSIGLIGEGALAYAILAYIAGNANISEYLNILFVRGSGELSVFLSSVAGASLGFLWFNAHPAQIFMGDTGSLSLGGAIGITAILIKQEILLLLVGGVFVIEALSVITQVIYFKSTQGRRIFKMAPLHHHFEKLGMAEPKIVIRFWILGVLFMLLALSTLKIR